MAAETLNMGTLFPPELVKELFIMVGGHSSVAKLAKATPIAFVGNEVFTFSMDNEANLVGEGEKKEAGGIKVAPIVIRPLKIEYGARVSEEFMTASEEQQLEILKAFNEGFAKKIGRAIDIMAFHGLNPRTKVAAPAIGKNSMDTHDSVTAIDYDEVNIEANVEDAIASIDEKYDVNGMAMAKAFSSELASLTVNGVKQYPQLGWGANPKEINGLPTDVNSTVSFGDGKDMAILGDFNALKWGYSKGVKMSIIEYGDPDGTGMDLKHYGQVYIRCEAYVGHGILDGAAFARIRKTA